MRDVNNIDLEQLNGYIENLEKQRNQLYEENIKKKEKIEQLKNEIIMKRMLIEELKIQNNF